MGTLRTVAKSDRAAMRIVIADGDRNLRGNLRQALAHAGFVAAEDVGSAEQLRAALAAGDLDLILVDARLPDDDGAELVRALRYSRCGGNPFMAVIMTTWPEAAADLGRLIGAGPDHILLKPVAPQAIFARMDALIERRKPFVATSGYLGPDRRRDTRPGTETIPTFEVPNTLRQRARGEPVDETALQRAIDDSFSRLGQEMARRQAFRIVFLVERAVPLLLAGENAAALLDEVAASLRELASRVDGGGFAHVADLAATLDRHLVTLTGAAGGREAKNLALLRKLAEALYLALNHGSDTAVLADKVRHAVEAYDRRRRDAVSR